MNETEFRQHLRGLIQQCGTQKQFAERHGISKAFLSDVLSGRRDPSRKLLEAIGFVKVVTYQRRSAEEAAKGKGENEL